MTMTRCMKRKYGVRFFRHITTLLLSVISVMASERVDRYIADIKAGSLTYYTPEAARYLFRTHPDASRRVAESSERKVAAEKSLRACVSLGEIGPESNRAIGTLVSLFPRAIHVSRLENVSYVSSAGTFNDWVQTKAVSEKNKFLLNPPFLEYATLSPCEHYVDIEQDVEFIDRYPRAGTVQQATVNLIFTITFNAGACALARITGEVLDADIAAWTRWWEQRGGSFTPVASPPVSNTGRRVISSGTSPDELVLYAQYRMALLTGDEFIGTIEAKDDTSITVETDKGDAFRFKTNLISSFDLLQPPPLKKKNRAGGVSSGIREAEILSFSQLKQRNPEGILLDVRLKGGSTFQGRLQNIDDEALKLDIDGSTIPFSREVIETIATVPPASPESVSRKKHPAEPEKPAGPFDTLIVRNPNTDEFGRPLEHLTYAGTVDSDNGEVITFTTVEGKNHEFPYSRVVRSIRHTETDDFDAIARYSKVLMCPDRMLLIDIPPGKKGRPFFKVCIDQYEYPNKKDIDPLTNVSFTQAREYCTSQGKRLCSVDEWQWSCSGLEAYTYPYGMNFVEQTCNTEGNKRVESSGTRSRCVSKFGVYDMVGNVFEWVTDSDGNPMLMGGPYAKCDVVSPGLSGEAKPQVGFRCCKGYGD